MKNKTTGGPILAGWSRKCYDESSQGTGNLEGQLIWYPLEESGNALPRSFPKNWVWKDRKELNKEIVSRWAILRQNWYTKAWRCQMTKSSICWGAMGSGFRVQVGGDKMKLERKQGQVMCGQVMCGSLRAGPGNDTCQTKEAWNLFEWW